MATNLGEPADWVRPVRAHPDTQKVRLLSYKPHSGEIQYYAEKKMKGKMDSGKATNKYFYII